MEQLLGSARQQTFGRIILVALFVLLYLVLLGQRPLFIPDEMRYGEIPREMLATGNWIVPRLNGLLYFEKPPFGHWMNAISLWLLGENPFAVRFASALSTGVSALMVFAIGRHFFRSRVVPFLAVFVFLTTLEVQVVGTFSVLDPIFSAAINAGILVMAVSSYALGHKRMWLLALAGVLFGIAFLTKGFLALALPAIVLAPWLVLRKEYAFLFRQAWIAVGATALTIAPWALAIHAEQPDFWRYFFWVEHIQRFASDNAQHKEPIYYFLMFLPALAFPWILVLPASLNGLRSDNRRKSESEAILLLALWAIIPFTFFSIASGKLATYILPCFVPFSLLIAVGLSSITVPPRSMKSLLIMAAAAILLLTAVVIYVDKSQVAIFSPAEFPKKLALLGSLFVMASLLFFAALSAKPQTRILSVGVSVIPFMLALPLSVPDMALARKAPEAFIVETVSQVPENTVIVTNGSLVRATSWSAKRTDVFVIENGGETTYGLTAADGKGRFLTPSDLRGVLAREESVLILCKDECDATTMDLLPSNVVSTSAGNFFAHHVSSKSGADVPAASE